MTFITRYDKLSGVQNWRMPTGRPWYPPEICVGGGDQIKELVLKDNCITHKQWVGIHEKQRGCPSIHEPHHSSPTVTHAHPLLVTKIMSLHSRDTAAVVWTVTFSYCVVRRYLKAAVVANTIACRSGDHGFNFRIVTDLNTRPSLPGLYGLPGLSKLIA